MSRVQRAHGRNQTYDTVFGAREARMLFHPGDRSDCFHVEGFGLRESGARSHSTLAVKMHQVGEDRLRAVLSQHGGDLTAMVGAVIHEVLHGLPEGILVHAKLQGLVFESTVQILLSETTNETQQTGLEFIPMLA